MGCDGGTIPKRGELVRTKKKPEEKDKASDLSFKWGHCSITQEPLQSPIVACQLGRLYNKTSVIEAILDQTKLPDQYKHIKSLKDVKELNLTDNPEYRKATETKDSHVVNISPYICPVIGLEMNGKYRFLYFWNCGCVLSERALRAIKSSNCHKCQRPFSEEDIVVLNGTEEDNKLMEERMSVRCSKLKAEKKMKKNGKSSASATATAPQDDQGSSSNSPPACDDVKQNGENKNVGKSIKDQNGSGQNVAKIVNGTKGKGPVKRGNATAIEDPDFKKTRVDYSVAKDPKATEVFKSLFTTHKSAEKQTKAHWVTYNPFYN